MYVRHYVANGGGSDAASYYSLIALPFFSIIIIIIIIYGQYCSNRALYNALSIVHYSLIFIRKRVTEIYFFQPEAIEI